MDIQQNELFLTCDQVRSVDQVAINKFGIPGILLMENAARQCVDVLEEVGIDGPVLIVCGKGNNGGDGFAMARHLLVRRYQVKVILLGSASDLKGDAKTNFEILTRIAPGIVEIQSDGEIQQFQNRVEENPEKKFDWIVDAILGTGAKGSLKAPLPEFLSILNSQSGKKFAVDIPSGMDCDSGESLGEVFVADQTGTFVKQKIGFRSAVAQPFLGRVTVLDIGFPDACWAS